MLRVTKPILFIILFVGLAALPGPSNSGTAKHETTRQTGQEAERKPREAEYVVYKNKQYRFRFLLPKSWKGYSILVSEWSGGAMLRDERNQQGPEIVIRQPLWTEANSRQDIPIMVFTRKQWGEADNFIFSAGPTGPGEIGRNAKYVFALPPRFNYADVIGVEEVNEMLQHNPLHPF